MSLIGMKLTVLKTEIGDLKNLISKYDQNLGSIDLYLKDGRIKQALKEIKEFSDELTSIEKVLHERYGN